MGIRNGISGIYAIRNLVNNKVYVGSAKCINKRWLNHRSDFRLGKGINDHIQRSYDKYGLENFSFSILELCFPHALLDREKYWIELLRSTNSAIGYNINVPYNDKVNAFIELNKNKPKVIDRLYKNVVCIDMTSGLFELLAWDVVKDKYNISSKNFSSCICYWTNWTKNCIKSHHGIIYIPESIYDPTFDYIGYKRERKDKKQPKVKKHYSEWNKKRIPIIVCNMETGEEVEYMSIFDCCRLTGLDRCSIRKVLKSPYKERYHRGFYFKRKE